MTVSLMDVSSELLKEYSMVGSMETMDGWLDYRKDSWRDTKKATHWDDGMEGERETQWGSMTVTMREMM